LEMETVVVLHNLSTVYLCKAYKQAGVKINHE
jgi:hypothetical protein